MGGIDLREPDGKGQDVRLCREDLHPGFKQTMVCVALPRHAPVDQQLMCASVGQIGQQEQELPVRIRLRFPLLDLERHPL